MVHLSLRRVRDNTILRNVNSTKHRERTLTAYPNLMV